jgi:plastocyanin
VKRLLALSACLAAAMAATAAPAGALERVEGTFFAEYGAGSYTVDQGEIVLFVNRDPFLTHGVTSDDASGGDPLFEAPVIKKGGTRLLRGAPFLTTGSYEFHCPVHPEMASRLDVNASGAPLPPDGTAPSAGVKVKRISLAGLLRRRKLRVRANPAEVADANFKASAGGVPLAAARRTYLTVGPRTLVLKISRAAARSLKSRVAELRPRGRRVLKLRVAASLVDLAGNGGTSRGGLSLRLPGPPRPGGKKAP